MFSHALFTLPRTCEGVIVVIDFSWKFSEYKFSLETLTWIFSIATQIFHVILFKFLSFRASLSCHGNTEKLKLESKTSCPEICLYNLRFSVSSISVYIWSKFLDWIDVSHADWSIMWLHHWSTNQDRGPSLDKIGTRYPCNGSELGCK